MLEKHIQRNLKKALLKSGQWKKVLKFESPSEDSYPDLIALADGPCIAWIEVKQPGEQPTVKQSYRHEQLRAMGFDVYVVHSANAADAIRPGKPVIGTDQVKTMQLMLQNTAV